MSNSNIPTTSPNPDSLTSTSTTPLTTTDINAAQTTEDRAEDDSQHSPIPDTSRDMFYQLLHKTRAEAKESRGYSSEEFCAIVTAEIQRRCQGKTPYPWQLDVAEAIYLGLDSVLIAGTGAGKTLPFAMPLLADPNGSSKIIIVSTLNELEKDQAVRFRKMGISAAAVNGESYSSEMHDNLVAGKYRIIITSPEMILEHPQFSKLIRNPEWMESVLATIVDEAHCIVHWGNSFRRHFAELEKIRSFMPISRPILIASATLPPSLLDEVLERLAFSRRNMFLVNLGNDRINITPVVHRLGSPTDYSALDFALDEAFQGGELRRTIIYVTSRDTARLIWLHLRDLAPDAYKDQLDYMHAGRGEETKQEIMYRFRTGKIRVLIATEVAGMGMDIPDIRRVIQFCVPGSLSELLQHLGRAGRDGEPAEAIVMIEPSVFQTVLTGKKGEMTDVSKMSSANDKPSRNKVKQERLEANLTTSVPTETEIPPDVPVSRRKRNKDSVSDGSSGSDDNDDNGEEHEDNNERMEDVPCSKSHADSFAVPSTHLRHNRHEKSPHQSDDSASENEGCSSNDEDIEDGQRRHRKKVEEALREWIETIECRRKISDNYFNNPVRTKALAVPCCDNCIQKRGKSQPSALTEPDLDILALIDRLQRKPDATSAPGDEPNLKKGPKRYTTRLNAVKQALCAWRIKYWWRYYSFAIFEPVVLLPEKTLATLATWRSIQTIDDVKAIKDWTFRSRLGEAVLECIKSADEKWVATNEENKKKNSSKRRKLTESQQPAKRAQYNAVRREKTRQRRIDEGKEQTAGMFSFVAYDTTKAKAKASRSNKLPCASIPSTSSSMVPNPPPLTSSLSALGSPSHQISSPQPAIPHQSFAFATTSFAQHSPPTASSSRVTIEGLSPSQPLEPRSPRPRPRPRKRTFKVRWEGEGLFQL